MNNKCASCSKNRVCFSFNSNAGTNICLLEEEKDKEIERLNNIVNELEKDIDLELYKARANDEYNNGLFNAFRYIKDELQELKEVKSNE